MHTHLSKSLFIKCFSNYEQTEAFAYQQLLVFMHTAHCLENTADSEAVFTFPFQVLKMQTSLVVGGI